MTAIPKSWDYFLSNRGGGLLDAAQSSGHALGLFSQMHRDGGWTPGTLDTPADRSQETVRATEDLLPATTQTVEVASFDVSIATNGTFHTIIDLTGLSATDGFIIQGDVANDRAGHSVSGAGDVNGDGFADLIVGASGGNDGGIDSGEAYVIFGKASGFGTVDLTGLASIDGFIIQGDAAGDNAGFSVSGAGDVNGDGFADLIVGASGGNDGGINAGEAYVVFGKASGFGTVDLSGLASADGFIIQGDATGDNAGFSVSGAGDVNGDGLTDLIVGASGGNDGGIDAGETYVIFGKASGLGMVDLSGLALADGFIIQGDAAGDNAGFSVSGAGDVNGDGFADLILGASGGNDGGINAGEAYVMFGKASGFGTVDLSGLASADGFIIQGNATGDNAGWSVSGAGDVNGDGFADLIVGAPYGDDGGPNAGQAYVIFGKTSGFGTVDLGNLAPADGFVIQGEAAGDNAGFSVSGAGDVNGDGLADLIVGARYGDDGGDRAGEAYVIFGKTSGFGTVGLGILAPVDGFIIQGDGSRDNAGWNVSGAGDVNGDGFADLIVGASGGDDGGSGSGEAYVIFGGDFTGAVTHLGTEANDNLTGTADDDIMIGGLGDDVLTGTGGSDRISGNGGNDTLVGGEDDDYLDGGGGNDNLNGSTGIDTMQGGDGDDIYFVDNAGDVVVEGSNQGTDQVQSSVSITLASNIENGLLLTSANLDLTGNAFGNTLFGNAGNNTLDGGAGVDVMAGGAGDDTYIVDLPSDFISEQAAAGTDSVQSTVNYSLRPNIENLTLLGTANLQGIGNAENNILIGNSGANRLNGSLGADTMTGGDGNDIYSVDDAGDVVTENANEGIDTILSFATQVLGANVERLYLFGTADIDATGNGDNNGLLGNDGDNALSGEAGNDLLFGGLGNDTMTGGAGNDTFFFHTALDGVNNVETLIDFSHADDTMRLDSAVFTGLSTGLLSANAFLIGTAAGDADDRIIYDDTTGDLFFDADGNGAAAQVQFATLDDVPADVAFNDFLVI